MITPPTWVILVPYADGGPRSIWREHTCGRVHSERDARALLEPCRIVPPYVIAQIRLPLKERQS